MKRIASFIIAAMIGVEAIASDEIISMKIDTIASGTGSSMTTTLPISGYLEGVMYKCANATSAVVSVDLVLKTTTSTTEPWSGITLMDVDSCSAAANYLTIRKIPVHVNGVGTFTNVAERIFIPNCTVTLQATNPSIPNCSADVRLIIRDK